MTWRATLIRTEANSANKLNDRYNVSWVDRCILNLDEWSHTDVKSGA